MLQYKQEYFLKPLKNGFLKSTKTLCFHQDMTEKIAFEVGHHTSKIKKNLGEKIGFKTFFWDCHCDSQIPVLRI